MMKNKNLCYLSIFFLLTLMFGVVQISLAQKDSKKIKNYQKVEAIQLEKSFQTLNKKAQTQLLEKVEKIRRGDKKTWKLRTLLRKTKKENEKFKAKNLLKKEKFSEKEKKEFKAELKKRHTRLKMINDQIKKDLERRVDKEFSRVEKKVLKSVSPNYLFELQNFVSDDTQFANQWSLNSIGEGGFATTGTEKPIIALIDTGVDTAHEDIAGSLWTSATCVNENGNPISGGCTKGGYDFVDNDDDPFANDYAHGTAVAGLIGAQTNNAKGIASLANNEVEVMALRACCTAEGFFEEDSIVKAIHFAVNNGADVINMSFGGPSASPTLQSAIDYAETNGVVITAAAGNYGADSGQFPVYPASFDNSNIISVASHGSDGNLSSFSNYGQNAVDLMAPGANVLTTALTNQYQALSGTSFSAPLVASGLVKYLVIGTTPVAATTQLLSDVNVYDSLVSFIGGGRKLEFGEMNGGGGEVGTAPEDILTTTEPIRFVDEWFFSPKNQLNTSVRKRTSFWQLFKVSYPNSSVATYTEGEGNGFRTGSRILGHAGSGYMSDISDIVIESDIFLTFLEMKWGVVSSNTISIETVKEELYVLLRDKFTDAERYPMQEFEKEYLEGLLVFLDATIRRFHTEYPEVNEIILPNGQTFQVPAGTNAGSYATLKFLAKIADTQEEWETYIGYGPDSFRGTWQRITQNTPYVTQGAPQQVIIRTPPDPFLVQKPFIDHHDGPDPDTDPDISDPTKKKYTTVNFFLDHESNSGTLRRFDGKTFPNPWIQGVTPYDGHRGVDYDTDNEKLLPSHSEVIFRKDNPNSFYCSTLGKDVQNTRFEIKISQQDLPNSNKKEVYVARYLHLDHRLTKTEEKENEDDYYYWIGEYQNDSLGDYPEERKKIELNDIVGKSGNNGCSDGPHLHYEIVRYVFELNPDGTYSDTKPEIEDGIDPFGYWNDAGNVYASSFLTPPVENGSENEIIVDDLDVGFQNLNKLGKNWNLYTGGINHTDSRNNQALYTYGTVETPTSDRWEDWAFWVGNIPRVGTYDVKVFVPNHRIIENGTEIKNNITAHYYVYHRDGKEEVLINQEENRGQWVSLGRYKFETGAKAAVQLTDAIDVANTSHNITWADAVRWDLVPGTIFPDVDLNDWFRNFVYHANDNSIINGYLDGEYKPANLVNRAEALKMAYLSAGYEVTATCLNDPNEFEPGLPFTDIESNQWYCPYVKDAWENNRLASWPSRSDGLFHPASSMTRLDVANLISSVWKVDFTKLDDYMNNRAHQIKTYSDINLENNLSVKWMSHAYIKDYAGDENLVETKNSTVISGYPDGTFKPQENVNRAEMAKFVVNTKNYLSPQSSTSPQSLVYGPFQIDTSTSIGKQYEQYIDENNNAPSIQFTNPSMEILEGDTIEDFQLIAQDADSNDVLSYFWYAPDGEFATAVDTTRFSDVHWTAPMVSADTEMEIFAMAGDGRGKVDSATLIVTVKNTTEATVLDPANFDVVSTTSGGLWTNPATWVGGQVPTDASRVLIDGSVQINVGTLNVLSLGITSNGMLSNKQANALIVAQDLINYGTITRGIAQSFEITSNTRIKNYGQIVKEAGLFMQDIELTAEQEEEMEAQMRTNLYILTKGELYNEGLWAPYQTETLAETEIKNSTTLDGVIYSKYHDFVVNTPNVVTFANYADDRANITGTGIVKFMGNVAGISISVPEIRFSGDGFQNITGDIYSDATKVVFEGNGEKGLSGRTTNWGTVIFNAPVLINADVTINGNVEVKTNSVIKNGRRQDVTLTINGNFVNNGTVTDNSSGSLTLVTQVVDNCVPPVSGDWIVTESCEISQNIVAPANVIVKTNVVLTIPADLTLDINKIDHYLMVENGGGVLVKQGGAIK